MVRAIALLVLAACGADPEPKLDCGDGVVGEFEECDDGNAYNGDGCSRCNLDTMVTVAWRFYPTVGGEPLPSGCLPGVETVELVTELSTTASYPCAAHRYGTVNVTERERRVIARLRDGNGESVAESLPLREDMYQSAYVDFYADGGWVRAWYAGECTEETGVVLTLVPVDGGAPIIRGTSCWDGSVDSIVSGVAKAGVYDVTLKANDIEQTIPGVTVRPNSGVTDLDFD